MYTLCLASSGKSITCYGFDLMWFIESVNETLGHSMQLNTIWSKTLDRNCSHLTVSSREHANHPKINRNRSCVLLVTNELDLEPRSLHDMNKIIIGTEYWACSQATTFDDSLMAPNHIHYEFVCEYRSNANRHDLWTQREKLTNSLDSFSIYESNALSSDKPRMRMCVVIYVCARMHHRDLRRDSIAGLCLMRRLQLCALCSKTPAGVSIARSDLMEQTTKNRASTEQQQCMI